MLLATPKRAAHKSLHKTPTRDIREGDVEVSRGGQGCGGAGGR